MALTRNDLLVWLEPEQAPASGLYDWSRFQRTCSAAGTPAFSTDVITLDGSDDHLLVADAINPGALTADGFTILTIFRATDQMGSSEFFFSLKPDNGNAFADCFVGGSQTVSGRLNCVTADANTSTPSGVGATKLPATAAFPGAASNVYMAALRWDPSNSGQFRITIVKAGDNAAQVAASTTTQTGRGAPEQDTSDLYIGVQGNAAPTFANRGQWNMLRFACVSRALTDAELAALIPSDSDVASYISMDQSSAAGAVSHRDAALLDASRFGAAIRTARTRNVHIVIGPGESHCGTGALASGAVPGIHNILQQACGRAVGLSGVGLTGYSAIPLSLASFSSVHHLPMNTSASTAWWAAKHGQDEPTIGLWSATTDSPVRRSVSSSGSRSVNHLQRQAVVPANNGMVGIEAMTGMEDLWSLARLSFDEVSIYANAATASGTYRFSELPAGGDYTAIGDWTQGATFTAPPSATITVQRFAIETDSIGFAVENIGGAGANVRLGFFDVRSPEPGVRIGCNGLALGGMKIGNLNTAPWYEVAQLAEVDYLGLCVPITNDSGGTPTPMDAWWHAAQTLIRTTITNGGPDGEGGDGRAHGIWIPVEGNMAGGQRTDQRARADLLAGLAVELGVDLVSFPMFVDTYDDGATTLYDGVHLGAAGFGAVTALFEESVMPRLGSAAAPLAAGGIGIGIGGV